MNSRLTSYLLALVGLICMPTLAFADNSDDTLGFYLSKADVVVVGTLAHDPDGPSSREEGINRYSVEIVVEDVLAGDLEQDTIRAAVVRFERDEADQIPGFEADGRFIFFLSVGNGEAPHYTTCDMWFGVTQYSSWMARSLKRLADQQAEEAQEEEAGAAQDAAPARPNLEDAHLAPADGSYIQGEFIDLGENDRLLLRYICCADSGVGIERVTDGTVVWRVHAASLGVAHNEYQHDIRAAIEDSQLVFTSYGSAGTFSERRDLATGELIERVEDKRAAGEINREGAAQEALDASQQAQEIKGVGSRIAHDLSQSTMR